MPVLETRRANYQEYGVYEESLGLAELVDQSGPEGLLVYIYGPPGTGKGLALTQLMRARPDIAWTMLSAPRFAAPVLEAINTVACGMRRRHRWGLLIDGYDGLAGIDGAVRRALIELPAGGMVIIAGRTPPERLWPGQAAWRSRILTRRMPGLSQAQAVEFCNRRGVWDAGHIAELIKVTQGQAGLLAIAADALGSWRHPVSSHRVGAFTVEQLLRPGSLRGEWHLRTDSNLDLVLAVASLVPAVDREMAETALGEETAYQGWKLWQATGIAVPLPDGWCAVPETVRVLVMRTVQEERATLVAAWKSRMLRGLYERITRDEINPQLIEAFLVLAGEQSGRWATSQEVSNTWCLGEGTEERADFATGKLAAGRRVLFCRDRQGGWVGGVRVLAGSDSDALQLTLDVEEGGPAAVDNLLRRMAPWFASHQLVRVVDGEERLAPEVMERWKFRRAWSLAGPCWELAFPAGFQQWLLGFMEFPPAEMAPEWPQIAKQALDSLEHPDVLKALMERWMVEPPEGVSWRVWILQCLENLFAESDGGERDVLLAYYRDRLGSHDWVANHLHLSRATYFRRLRQGIKRLGDVLASHVQVFQG
ncbi:MAG: hypothetical protein M0Z53_04655 [Thermaerobacter sp.]|nr:hypothetical protein [Thermaerobacter sp.]